MKILYLPLLGTLMIAGCAEYPSSEQSPTEADLHDLAEAIEAYKTRFGRYPASGNRELAAALRENAPRAQVPRLSSGGEIVDRWGRPLVYRHPAMARKWMPFDLYSVGPNGQDDGSDNDDIAYDLKE